MSKLFLLIVIINSVFFLSACQIHKNFVVRNSHDSEITLEYRVKPILERQGDIFKPEIEFIDDSSWFQKRMWKPMPEENYSFDTGERKFTLK